MKKQTPILRIVPNKKNILDDQKSDQEALRKNTNKYAVSLEAQNKYLRGYIAVRDKQIIKMKKSSASLIRYAQMPFYQRCFVDLIAFAKVCQIRINLR